MPLTGSREAPPPRRVSMARQSADGIITLAKTRHPNEAILILQGKTINKQNLIIVDGLVMPPFAYGGHFYSGFLINQLPFDGSYVGMAHSHPGSSNRPSMADLDHFFGYVSVIICHPYEDKDIGAYDRSGRSLEITITDSR